MKKLLLLSLILLISGCSNQPFGDSERTSKISAIQDNVQIGDSQKEIAFTDDNTDENFIIKSDAKDYYGWGTAMTVYFSITNISDKDQDANIVFSFGKEQSAKNVKKLTGNNISYETIPTIPATATTSEIAESRKEINTPIWSDISENKSFDIKKSKVLRKNTLDRSINKAFIDNFKVGVTNYYSVDISIPKKITENEWFLEVIGDDYGHLDPNNWTYEQKFNSLTDGDFPGQDSWVDGTTSGQQPQVQTSVKYEGAKALSCQNTAYIGVAYRDITALSGTGSLYFVVRTTDTAAGIVSLRGYSSGGTNYWYIQNNQGTGNWEFYDGTAWRSFGSWSNDTWVPINFEYDADTYKQRARTYNSGSWGAFSNWYNWRNAGSGSLSRIHIVMGGDTGTLYFDTLSPTDPTAAPAAPAALAPDDGLILFE